MIYWVITGLSLDVDTNISEELAASTFRADPGVIMNQKAKI
jgi:hypothetical protein